MPNKRKVFVLFYCMDGWLYTEGVGAFTQGEKFAILHRGFVVLDLKNCCSFTNVLPVVLQKVGLRGTWAGWEGCDFQ